MITRVRVHPSLAFEWINYTLSMIIWQYNAKVLILATGVLKFTVAKTIILLYNSSIEIEKETKMQKAFAVLTLRQQTAMLKELRTIHAQCRADYKAGKELLKADKAAARLEKQQAKALKQEQAILKAQLRLEKLLAKQAAPVGAKAIKANRKPSKVVTYGSEDNQIAAAIMAKKAKA